MHIDRLNEYELTPELDGDIADLLLDSFGPEFGGRSYCQQRHHVRFIARDNGVLLGHMALCYRDARLGDGVIPIWGLAEVATAAVARGKGVATQLLAAATAFTRTTPAVFFVLFGDRPIYAGNGFVPYRNSVTFVTMDGARTGSVETGVDNCLMVLPLTELAWDDTAPLDLLGCKF